MDSSAINNAGLPADAVEIVKLEARKEGIFAGLSSGLASAVIGQRLFGLKRNATLFCGVLSGVLSGFLFTQVFLDFTQALAWKTTLEQAILAFRDTALAQLRAEEARLRSQPKISPETQAENLSV